MDYLEQYDCAQDDIHAAEQYVQMPAPATARRIAVSEIYNWDNEIECTQVFWEKEIVSNIIYARDIVADDEEQEDEIDGTHNNGTIGEQLDSVTYVKRICRSLGLEKDRLLSGLQEL